MESTPAITPKTYLAPTPSDDRVRLLIVNSTLHIGGAEQVAADLAGKMNQARFAVSACYLKQPGLVADQMRRAGVDLQPIPGLIEGKRDYLTFLKLRRLIRERNIQIIHTHDIHGMIDGAACRLTTPGVRFVHTFHFGNYPHRSARHKFIERALWRVPDRLIAVGQAQARSISECYGIPTERLQVVWNGVEDSKGLPPPEPVPGFTCSDNAADEPVIASVSTLIQQKGLEHLLNAAALLRDSGDRFRLVIAGEGALRSALERQVRDLHLTDRVTFLGWVPQAARRVLPLCDIFVQSSLWEAMSVVLLEAMAAARPMVITSVGENPFVVQPGKSALVVPPADPHSLAAALRSLLRDRQLRGSLATAARRRYEERLTVGHMVATHERLYEELVNSRQTASRRA